MFLRKIIL